MFLKHVSYSGSAPRDDLRHVGLPLHKEEVFWGALGKGGWGGGRPPWPLGVYFLSLKQMGMGRALIQDLN